VRAGKTARRGANHETTGPRERAFLVGMEWRSRRRSGAKAALTAGAQAARDSALTSASAASGAKSASKAPAIPEFDAEESLAELRTLAGSAGAEVVGEILQRRDRPDPATLVGAGKLEEIAGAVLPSSAILKKSFTVA
jgi:GTP-binding protein HflX